MALRDGRFWSLLDERHPRGGRAKAWLFLTHPGPSLLVTVVVVAAAGLLARRVPSERTAVGLVLVMLPAQFGIGALNDWADAGSDRVSKPFKPLARGLVGRRAALAFAGVMMAVSVGAAAWLGVDVLLVDLLGLSAGVAYDLALKRTRAAVLAWWAGITAVPLLAMVITGRFRGGLDSVPLCGLVALALLIANGLPDRDGDRAAGGRTLPAVVGENGSRVVMGWSLLAAAIEVLIMATRLDEGAGAFLAGALLVISVGLAGVGARGRRLVFPALAALVAVAAVSWLAALPAGPG